MEYIELLRDPRWQKRKAEICQRDGWCCRKCGDSKSNLQVHHFYYKYGLMPWEYPDEALITYCDLCHEKTEFIKKLTGLAYSVLHQLGFPNTDISEVIELVGRTVWNNEHKESARKYMSDIKILLSNG